MVTTKTRTHPVSSFVGSRPTPPAVIIANGLSAQDPDAPLADRGIARLRHWVYALAARLK